MIQSLYLKTSTKTILAIALIGFIGVPFPIGGSTPKPDCSLSVTTQSKKFTVDNRANMLIAQGDEVYIEWTSQNALTATDDNYDHLPLFGVTTKSPTETQIYSFIFESGEERVTCSVKIYVIKEKTGWISSVTNLLQSVLFRLTSGKKTAQINIQQDGNIKKFSRSDIVTVEKEQVEVISLEQTSKIDDIQQKPIVPPVITLPPSIPKPIPIPTPIPVPVPPPIIYQEADIPAIANTTLAVELIPLLSGGVANTGVSIPISYLQIANVGTETAYLKGFWIRQNGNGPELAVIGLTTVDDRGGSRGYVGGVEGISPFKDGLAFAPTMIARFEPGQIRLFTIKAVLTKNITPYIGGQLKLDLTSLETNAGSVQGNFPIRGVTWTIGY